MQHSIKSISWKSTKYCLVLTSCWMLCGQESDYKAKPITQLTPFYFHENVATGNYCPIKTSFESPLDYKPTDTGVIPVERRKSVGKFVFGAMDDKTIKTEDVLGQVVVISLFNTTCQPSWRQVAEMARLQPRERTDRMRILPVSLHGWDDVRPFLTTYRKQLGNVAVFTIGAGTQSISALKVDLTALPMTYVIDRHGRLFSAWSGHSAGRLSERLQAALAE